MSLRDQALFLACAYPGGATALAHRMGKNPTTFNHELKGTGTAKLGLEDAELATDLSGDLRILEAWCAQHGLVVIRVPTVAGADTSGCLMKLSQAAKEFSDLVQEISGDMDDARLSDNEMSRIERDGADVLAAVHALLNAARALNAKEHQ